MKNKEEIAKNIMQLKRHMESKELHEEMVGMIDLMRRTLEWVLTESDETVIEHVYNTVKENE